jgi:DNA-binding MarR family transcriptional regulator
MRRLQQHYARDIDTALREAGFSDIRAGQAQVIPFVPPGGRSVGELAVAAGVTKQTMAQSVDQLVRAGYLARQPNPRDARSQLLFLTDRGQAVRGVAASAGDSVEQRWAELTSPAQLDAHRWFLEKLLGQLDGQEPDPDPVPK